jgi:integrase
MPNDLVPGSAAAADTRPELRRDAGGRLVELGPRELRERDVLWSMPFTLISLATVTRAFHAALLRAELPHTRFHDLRHAAATFLLAQGMTLEDVKNLLGHSSITLTSNTYGHVLEQRQRQVARAMDAVLGG